MSYLTEAFKALDALNEDTFSVSDDGIKKLAEFEDNDDLVDEITVYDADAEDTEDLEDSYVGKVIVDCNVCHSKIYKDKSDVVIDEETQNANIDEECPYCYSTDGFKVIGEVAPMTTETEETEDDAELDESLKESVEPSAIDRVQNLLDIIDKSFEVEDDTFMNEAILDEDNKIRLTSIPGVTRNREKDFTDDGNRFQAYLYKGLIPITYLRTDGEVYITIAFHYLANINYEEYKKFPSYTHADDFNGVSVGNFDPQVFKKNLDAAYDDVTMFLDNVEEVDSQQLEDRIKVINSACKEYEEKVKQYIKDNALNIIKLSDYKFSELKNYVTDASNRTADAIRNASASSQRSFMSDDIEKLKERISNSWSFKFIENIINSVKESCNEELEDSEVAESVDLATKENTVAGVLAKHMSELYDITDVNELRKAVIDIVDNSDIADKAIVSKLRRDLFSKKSVGALLSTITTYMTGTKVAKVGRKNEAVEENIGTDIDEYQQWVDYDMKRYGKISDQTNKEIKEAGLQVVKDKYGDYQVIAGKYDESLEESVKDITITTDDSKTIMTSDDEGKVTLTTEPVEQHKDDEVIEPLTDETEAEIEANDGEEDIDIEDFDEESFDELGEGYFKNVYENVNSFKTSNITTKDNKVIVEGVITFDNNVKKNTSFLFESANKTKNGRYRFIGENLNVTKGNKAFSLIGNVTDKKFLSESMNYNYRTKNDIGKFIRCCGTIKRG